MNFTYERRILTMKMGKCILRKTLRYPLTVGLCLTILFLHLPISFAQEKRTEIRIGVSISLSGPFGGLGQEAKAGMDYAVEDINKGGGISVAEGKDLPVRLVVYDDKSDQTTSVGNFERLITVDKVDFLFGHVATPIIMADAGVAERYGVPYLTAGITSPPVHKGETFKWTWAVFHRSDLQHAAVREMAKVVAPDMAKKVAIWRENTVLGEVLEKYEAPQFVSAGWDVTILPYSAGSKDFTDLILKSKQKEVSMIVGIPTPPDTIAMVRQMKDLAYAPKMAFLTRGASVVQFKEALGPDAEYIADSAGWSPNVDYPGNRELSKRYQKNTGRVAAAMLGPTYACAQVLFDAVKRAGTADRNKVRNAIQKTDLMTVNGRLTFPEQGSPVVKIILNQWQKGEYVAIWPPEVAFGKPMFPIPSWDKR